MHGPEISIVVPSYNAAPFLRAFCESLQAQTFKDFEVLIGDDGSTDASVETIQSFLADPRFRLFQWKPNRGVHHGTVFLLEQARGKFWCNPGADDVLEPAFLEKRHAKLAAHPEASMVHGPAILIDENDQQVQGNFADRMMPVLEKRLPESLPAERMLRILLQHNLINIPSALIHLDATRRVLPFFAPRWLWALDWFFWILLAATGSDFLWDGERLHRYRLHGASNSLSPQKQNLRRAERKLVPLCGLYTASEFSPMAKIVWLEERTRLYRWWLVTAVAMSRSGNLKESDLELAAKAFSGAGRGVRLALELIRHGLPASLQYLREKELSRRQLFPVSGLSLIDDPLFRAA